MTKQRTSHLVEPIGWGRRVQRVMTPAPSFKTKTKVKERGKWTAETMKMALESIESGKMSGHEASRYYSIPESTIRSWKTKKVKSKKLGPPTALSSDEEIALVDWCLNMQEVAHCITLQMLKSKVKQICEGRRTPFKVGLPGDKWWKYFQDRHPQLVLRTPQALDGKRARNISPQRCERFYKFLEETLSEGSYSPSHVWNMDETGLSASIKVGGVRVIARRGSKAVLIRSSSSREWLTVVVCINASGCKIPSQYIFSGKEYGDNYVKNCEPGAVMSMQAHGWMTKDLFLEWLRHFRESVPGGVSTSNPHLLLLDGHCSHLDEEAIILARGMGLQIALLPPHSSHRLQPLDVGVFRAFKIRFGQLRSELIATNPSWLNGDNNKAMLAELASNALATACNPENIRAGFKKTGIHPFNPQALDSDFGPSNVFDLQEGKCGIISDSSLEESSLDEEDHIEEDQIENQIEEDQIEEQIEELIEEQLSQRLSQLSVDQEEPTSNRLAKILAVPLLPPPRVREDPGQIIASFSCITSDAFEAHLVRKRLIKEAKEEGIRQRKLAQEEENQKKKERLEANRVQKIEEKRRRVAIKLQKEEELRLQKAIAKAKKESLRIERLAAKVVRRPKKGTKENFLLSDDTSDEIASAYRESIKFAVENGLPAPTPPPYL